jgi:UDP-N-acetylglucosamine 2-epimerase (non-hydrolysing)/GDP/UDP-N,N'-diacetylbacillosamine 2-epimerase (hydrolysing)
MKRTKICVVTTSRADYGSLCRFMEAIQRDKRLKLQVVATGMHLLKEFGLTARVIAEDGFKIDAKVSMISSVHSQESISQSIGVGITAFTKVLRRLKPDWVVIFGDRFELFSIAIPSLILQIPLAHISGGEITEGAVDDVIRHAVTKMANVHFPAAEAYRKRIIQMGENPKNVFNFGHLGLDNLRAMRLYDREELRKELGLKRNAPTALVTFHPETMSKVSSVFQLEKILNVIRSFDMDVVFTKANCDAEGNRINKRLANFCRAHPERYKLFDNLGQQRYLSCLKHLDVMIGNSSSGLFEAPSFQIPVVNIGDRQKGRLRSRNIIDVGYSPVEIAKAISKALSRDFKKSLRGMKNLYCKNQDGRVAERIKDVLRTYSFGKTGLVKKFYDINF